VALIVDAVSAARAAKPVQPKLTVETAPKLAATVTVRLVASNVVKLPALDAVPPIDGGDANNAENPVPPTAPEAEREVKLPAVTPLLLLLINCATERNQSIHSGLKISTPSLLSSIGGAYVGGG
jgi:hypothetical protein